MVKGDFPDKEVPWATESSTTFCDNCWEKGANWTRGRRGGATGTTLKGELRKMVPVLACPGRRMLLLCEVNPGRFIGFTVLKFVEDVGAMKLLVDIPWLA